jgi:CHRD domain-containing protein
MCHAQRVLVSLVLFVVAFQSMSAQSSRTFKTRLSPVPIDVSMQSTIAGTGSVTAVLTGARLSITGTFDGLKSPATIAQLHKSPVRGVRGPVVFDVPLTRGDALNGTLGGTFDLTPLQVADLEKGRLYLQVHSEKAPDGNLWGWLTPPQENKR